MTHVTCDTGLYTTLKQYHSASSRARAAVSMLPAVRWRVCYRFPFFDALALVCFAFADIFLAAALFLGCTERRVTFFPVGPR